MDPLGATARDQMQRGSIHAGVILMLEYLNKDMYVVSRERQREKRERER